METEVTPTEREEGHVKTQAEIGAIWLQAKECQGLLAATIRTKQNKHTDNNNKHKEESFPRVFRGNVVLLTP